MPGQNQLYISHILRYTPDPIRDEWLNIGVLVFDLATGNHVVRVIEEEREFARLRRLQPSVHEEAIRRTRDYVDDTFADLVQQFRAGSRTTSKEFQKLIEKWEGTLSNGIQLSGQKGVYALDLQTEADRLYSDHVGLERYRIRGGAPGSRAYIRNYCSQVWHEARIWQR